MHSSAPNDSGGVSQSVGSVIQMTNCSFGEDDGNNPNVSNPIVEININTPDDTENGADSSRMKQTVGSVLQIVGSVDGGDSKSITTTGGEFPEGINGSGHKNSVDDVSVGRDNRTLANILCVGYLDEADNASSLLNESTLPKEILEGNSRISNTQTVRNIIEIQDSTRQMSDENAEAINEKLKQQELEIEKLHELINALQNQVEILQTNSSERKDSAISTMNTLREHVEKRLLDFEESIALKDDIDIESLLRDVGRSCTYLREEMASMDEAHKEEMQQLNGRILELESRVENLQEDNQPDDGTFRVTEEDIEQLAQEWENSLYQ